MKKFKTVFFSLINFLLPKYRVDILYKKYYLERRNLINLIRTDNYRFLYRSPDYDDLNLLSRDNLNTWEKNSREIFFQLAKHSDVIFDIGAYTGIYCLIASKANPMARIHAFEPNPLLFDALKKNIKLNRSIKKYTLNNLALSNYTGKMTLYKNHDYFTSQFSLIHKINNAEKINVLTVSIDTYASHTNLNKIDLMKIDVEGAESIVLNGGSKAIKKWKPIILMEALTSIDLSNQAQILKQMGYAEPIQIPGNDYDSRNFLWTPLNYRLDQEVTLLLEEIKE